MVYNKNFYQSLYIGRLVGHSTTWTNDTLQKLIEIEVSYGIEWDALDGGGGGRGGGGAVMFKRFIEEAAALSGRLRWSLAGERSVRLVGSFLNILKSKNI